MHVSCGLGDLQRQLQFLLGAQKTLLGCLFERPSGTELVHSRQSAKSVHASNVLRFGQVFHGHRLVPHHLVHPVTFAVPVEPHGLERAGSLHVVIPHPPHVAIIPTVHQFSVAFHFRYGDLMHGVAGGVVFELPGANSDAVVLLEVVEVPLKILMVGPTVMVHAATELKLKPLSFYFSGAPRIGSDQNTRANNGSRRRGGAQTARDSHGLHCGEGGEGRNRQQHGGDPEEGCQVRPATFGPDRPGDQKAQPFSVGAGFPLVFGGVGGVVATINRLQIFPGF
mmetsp:Transcript_11055/g.32785  ORF Transcript_11055/g.32785 Transcript_11055/m.32785 type:complete len:281 (-) Transcript_11055:235-1077(-)